MIMIQKPRRRTHLSLRHFSFDQLIPLTSFFIVLLHGINDFKVSFFLFFLCRGGGGSWKQNRKNLYCPTHTASNSQPSNNLLTNLLLYKHSIDRTCIMQVVMEICNHSSTFANFVQNISADNQANQPHACWTKANLQSGSIYQIFTFCDTHASGNGRWSNIGRQTLHTWQKLGEVNKKVQIANKLYNSLASQLILHFHRVSCAPNRLNMGRILLWYEDKKYDEEPQKWMLF